VGAGSGNGCAWQPDGDQGGNVLPPFSTPKFEHGKDQKNSKSWLAARNVMGKKKAGAGGEKPMIFKMEFVQGVTGGLPMRQRRERIKTKEEESLKV